MTPAELAHPGRVEGGQARQQLVASDHAGYRVERLTGQPELAGAVDAGMAGQHLLDQRGSGTWHAEDEHRLSRVVAGAGEAVEQVRSEAFDQPIDETAVLGRVVLPACWRGMRRHLAATPPPVQ